MAGGRGGRVLSDPGARDPEAGRGEARVEREEEDLTPTVPLDPARSSDRAGFVSGQIRAPPVKIRARRRRRAARSSGRSFALFRASVAKGTRMLDKILIPVDGSSRAEAILWQIARLLR